MGWNEIKFLLSAIFAAVIIFALLAIPMFGGMAFAQKNYCSTLESLNPDYQFHWSFWTGCLVKIDGVYMDVDYINKTRQEIELNSK